MNLSFLGDPELLLTGLAAGLAVAGVWALTRQLRQNRQQHFLRDRAILHQWFAPVSLWHKYLASKSREYLRTMIWWWLFYSFLLATWMLMVDPAFRANPFASLALIVFIAGLVILPAGFIMYFQAKAKPPHYFLLEEGVAAINWMIFNVRQGRYHDLGAYIRPWRHSIRYWWEGDRLVLLLDMGPRQAPFPYELVVPSSHRGAIEEILQAKGVAKGEPLYH
ncbi:MAG: hypothetical protein AB1331_00230 [Bacillota bacterium]